VSVAASPIASVDAIALREREPESPLSWGRAETILVLVRDADGRCGAGEADAPAGAVSELVLMNDVHALRRGLRSVLVGRDPFELAALAADLYRATSSYGRRGLAIHAISAVDVALHDLVGKQLGRPVYELLGGACRSAIAPYATVDPGPPGERTLGEVMDVLAARSERALELGFRAVKVEAVFGPLATDRELVRCVQEARALLGGDVAMMVDFNYRWDDWRDALAALRALADCNLFFAEAVLRHDDLAGHARLAGRIETRLGGAEWAATVHECRQWLREGRVDVLQPDIGRCGGLTEIRRIAEAAALEGAVVVPHGMNTGVTAAASHHFAVATPNAPTIEFLHPALVDSRLQRELTGAPPPLDGGFLRQPKGVGLGIALDEDVIREFRVA